MNRFINLIILCFLFSVAGQSQTIKNKLSLETTLEIPDDINTRQILTGNSSAVDVPKSRSFSDPIFRLSLALDRPISNHFSIGIQAGMLGTFRNEYYYTSKEYRNVLMIPISCSIMYSANKKYKKHIPIAKLNLGYTYGSNYFNYPNFIIQEFGGFSYSFRLGLLFKRKNNDIKLFIGRSTIYNKVKIDESLYLNTSFQYNEVKNSYSLTIAYDL